MTSNSGTKPAATLAMTTIDCADPREEATFWSQLLGWDVAVAEDEYAMLTHGEQRLGFGRVDGWRAPGWPNTSGTKQFHLDLAVEDMAAAQARCEELGARVASPQPGEGWVVMIDPAGHPFCLTPAANWG